MNRDGIDPELLEIHDLALRLARRAGAIQREHYERPHSVETKSASIDLVTEVDRECEAKLVAELSVHRPSDAVLAEEGGGADRADAQWRWIIDPLDGTTNYAHGFPRFCVSIGVERNRERAVGVVYDPLLDELFHAVRGAGAWLGERRLGVSTETDFGRALLATGFAYDVHHSRDDNLASFARVLKAARGVRRDGSAALDLAYVAAGRLDAYWECGLHAWDVAAGLLLVDESGGKTSDLSGGAAAPSGAEIAASNGPLHAALLSLVGEGSARKRPDGS